MRKRFIGLAWMLSALLLGIAAQASKAEDAYFDIPVRELKLTDGTLPEATAEWNWRLSSLEPAFEPRIVLDGEGEGYPAPAGAPEDAPSVRLWRGSASAISREFNQTGHVALRAPAGKDVSGRLYVAKPDLSGMVAVRFVVPVSAAKPDAKSSFLRAKIAHYTRLSERGVPGGAWFRHQRARTIQQLAATGATSLPREPLPRPRQDIGTDETYDLFTGGRALSENLQLDRVLVTRGAARPDKDGLIDVASIQGITVREMDWKSLVRDLKPALDPLAGYIPADQHALFLPLFTAATRLADEAQRNGTPVLQLLEPRSEDAQTLERYQRQLGISLSGAARLIGPQMINSLALTGSDPYFRTGADVAVLMEAKDPATLAKLLVAQAKMAAQGVAGAKPIGGEVQGISYSGMRSPNRAVCSYVAALGNAVVVTNSPVQLRRLVSVYKGSEPSITTLPEYTFFRHRYKLGEPQETALLFLSDATIRRWCGPRWRIGSARRTLADAVLAEQQAVHVDELARWKPGSVAPLSAVAAAVDMGQLQFTSEGVTSSIYGSLAFATPIVELPLDKVTPAEADAYGRWRDSYQQNWRQFFDPIAVRFEIADQRLVADVTVMPLILGTDYRDFIAVVQGVKLTPDSGDPHDALAHFVLAINIKSQPIQQASSLASAMAPGLRADPLSWLGKSVAVYFDNDDAYWEKFNKLKPEEREGVGFLTGGLGGLPVAVTAEVSNGLKLTAFLTGLRAFVEQAAPGMTTWETLKHNEQSYVKVSPTEQARAGIGEDAAIYYYASGEALTVTLNEQVLKRAIDRQVARRAAKAGGKTPSGKDAPAAAQSWLGESVALHVDRKLLSFLGTAESLLGGDYQSEMQASAWGNLPILNEWKQRYPDQDPLVLYKRFAQTDLVCPGGGKYVWNEKWQTIESTVYGHPGQPKKGPPAPSVLDSIRAADFGLTFEEHGLRARASLERTPPAK